MTPPDILLAVLAVLVSSMLPLAAYRAGTRSGLAEAKARKRAWLCALGAAAWLAVTGALAHAGAFSDFDAVPPGLARVLVPSLLIVFLLAFSRFGASLADGLPYAALIGFQAFRIPVEGLLHWFHLQGRLPVEMTYQGWNWDILTGISALFMAFLAARGSLGRKAALAWNVAGLGLLLTIMSIGILSAPGPLRVFRTDPPNTLLFGFPHVWIPVVFVMAALLGHILLFRKILRETRSRPGTGRP